jgi:hypothetical protein
MLTALQHLLRLIKEPKARMAAGSQGRRETFSLVMSLSSPQRHFASCACSKQTVLRVKSKTSQCFIRLLFFEPSFHSLLHRHLSSDCFHFQPLATTRKCVDAVFSFHHHARLEESLQMMKRAQKLDPLSPDANTSLAYFLYFALDYDRSIRYCERALALEPNVLEALLLLGLIYEQKGLFEEAIIQFNASAEVLKEPTLLREVHLGRNQGPSAELSRKQESCFFEPGRPSNRNASRSRSTNRD